MKTIELSADAVELSKMEADTPRNPTPIKSEAVRMRQGAFLAAYGKTARVNRAAEAAAIDRSTHYDWLETDEEYAEAFRRTIPLAAQMLEDTAVDRATEGASDTMLIFLLKAFLPEKYRERQSIEHTGPGGGAISIEMADKIIRGS